MIRTFFVTFALSALCVSIPGYLCGQNPDDTGSYPVSVTHSGNTWTIAGQKNTVTLNETTLAVSIKAGSATWNLVPPLRTMYWSAYLEMTFG